MGGSAAATASKPGTYSPDRDLPRTKYGDPIPDSDFPHTQLGQNSGSDGVKYTQARTWDYNKDGKLTAKQDIDFYDHGAPGHANPHMHELIPNNPKTAPKGGYKRGKAEPFNP